MNMQHSSSVRTELYWANTALVCVVSCCARRPFLDLTLPSHWISTRRFVRVVCPYWTAEVVTPISYILTTWCRQLLSLWQATAVGENVTWLTRWKKSLGHVFLMICA